MVQGPMCGHLDDDDTATIALVLANPTPPQVTIATQDQCAWGKSRTLEKGTLNPSFFSGC